MFCVLRHPECSCRKKNQQQEVRARGLGLVSLNELCISFFDLKLNGSVIQSFQWLRSEAQCGKVEMAAS